MRNHGFTLIELIIVIILLGILAVYAAPRFFATGDTEVVAAQTSLAAMLRMQQQRAMQDTAAVGEYGVDIATDGDQITVTPIAPDGSSPRDPLQLSGLLINPSTTSLRFNALGCIDTCGQSDVIVTLSGNTSRSVCINRQGYISQGQCD